MDVVVGRIGRPQGIRGELTVEVRTDEPELRFAPGAVLLTRRQDAPEQPGNPPTVTVEGYRWQAGRMMLALEGVEDRNAAERLRDLLLAVEVDPAERPDDPDEFYDHQLVGLRVVTVDGVVVGDVHEVLHLPSQEVLEVRPPAGEPVLVPFVGAIVTAVDLAARTVTIDPPPGLLGDGPGTGTDGDPAAGGRG
jgi:16S rRNA processing protein RimM